MSQAEQLITANLDVWTSAIKRKASTGRGSNKKQELYGIKKLRELILELAVRGLLVPQDPNDEPAGVLLEKIAAEKELLVKEGKVKKAKKIPPISEADAPYGVPKGWVWAYLPEVLADDKYAIKRGPFGSAIKKAFFVSEGYKVYEQQNAIYDDFSLGEYYINSEKYEELKAFTVKPNDLIISCSGTVGKVAVAPSWMEEGVINQALLKITLNTSALSNEYFKILFAAYYMKTETLTDLKGTAQKNMVSVDTLKKEAFPYPPVNEQNRIVSRVDELMALCDQLEQQTESSLSAHQTLVETLLKALLDAAQSRDDASVFEQAWQRIAENFDVLFTTEHSIDQLKQTILQLAVMGKLVPQDPNDEPASVLLEKIASEKERLVKGKKIKKQKKLPPISEEEKPFELPESWEWCRLQEFVTVLGDGLHGTPTYDDRGEYFFVNGNNLLDGVITIKMDTKKVSEEEYLKYKKPLDERTVLVSINGTLGNVAFFNNEPVMLGKSACYFNLATGLSKFYIKRLVESPHFLEYAFKKATGSTIKNLGLKAMNSFPVALPPPQEQFRITERVSELMAICDSLKDGIRESQTTQLHLADAIAEQALDDKEVGNE